VPRGFRLPGFSYAQAPALRSGSVVVLDAKGREVPLLETSRYGRMVSSRSLVAACCPERRGYAHGQTGRGKRGPQECESPLPSDQDSLADLIPAADTSVGPIVRNVNTGTSAGVLHRRYAQRLWTSWRRGDAVRSQLGQRFWVVLSLPECGWDPLPRFS
jgi:hypothetical protein